MHHFVFVNSHRGFDERPRDFQKHHRARFRGVFSRRDGNVGDVAATSRLRDLGVEFLRVVRLGQARLQRRHADVFPDQVRVRAADPHERRDARTVNLRQTSQRRALIRVEAEPVPAAHVFLVRLGDDIDARPIIPLHHASVHLRETPLADLVPDLKRAQGNLGRHVTVHLGVVASHVVRLVHGTETRMRLPEI